MSGPTPAAAELTACRVCPRLAAFLDATRARHPEYFCRPVPAFGDPAPTLLIVGLAPGLHGANRTGRPFTGDYAGELLYRTLYEFGYASTPVSRAADDGLRLIGCRISNAVKCVPPANKPDNAEIKRCNTWLRAELAALPADAAVLALGQIAHRAVLMALDARAAAHPFAHGACHPVDGRRVYDSYHCSRYNTQTRRLTPDMFRAVFTRIRQEECTCPSSPSSSPAI